MDPVSSNSQGFSAIVSASASLFGLVLVAVTFGYRTAINKLEDVSQFKHFATWLWAAGLGCGIYYSYCFLIAVHMLRSTYTQSRLVLIIGLTSALLLSVHIVETVWFKRMGNADPAAFKWMNYSQGAVVLALFAIFTVLNWRAVFAGSGIVRYNELLAAIAFTLIASSIRAVFLVGFAFYSILLLHTSEEAQKRCPRCIKPVDPRATVCPHCGSEIGPDGGRAGETVGAAIPQSNAEGK